jgi:hypothetical protein
MNIFLIFTVSFLNLLLQRIYFSLLYTFFVEMPEYLICYFLREEMNKPKLEIILKLDKTL